MSTKIYNGIKFKSKDYYQLLQELLEVKNKSKEVSKNLISDRDLLYFISGNKLEDKDSFFIAQEFLDAADSNNKSKWTFSPNIHFSVVVYPTPEGDIYGYYFDSNKKEYNELLKPLYTDFHYQNQSDPPTNLSEEEWDFRREKWDQLVDYKFKDTGFTYEFVAGGDIDLWDLESRIKIILEKLKREKKIDSVI
jgi:hypothetical protein